jgi:hypothetical protein
MSHIDAASPPCPGLRLLDNVSVVISPRIVVSDAPSLALSILIDGFLGLRGTRLWDPFKFE